MKTKVILTVSILAVFGIGFMFGSLTSAASWIDRNNQNVYQGQSKDVATYVHALSAFRSGDEKGCANILENELESSLFALDNVYSTLVKQPDKSVYQTLKYARVYRTKYQWGQDNAKMTDDVEHTMTARVDHILSLGK
jgi:hypothetical protein